MDQSETRRTLGEIAEFVGGELHGPADWIVSRPAPADSRDPSALCFAGNAKFLEVAENSGVGAVLLSPELLPCRKPHIVVANPRAAFGIVLALWQRPLPLDAGIHPWASVHPTAKINPTAQIGPYAVIERGASVGARSRIYPFAYIGENCSVGDDCAIYPHATLYQDVSLGFRTIVHSGAVLGADGFGFEGDGAHRIKVPQVGSVETGADVEIGANTTIDRGTSGTTKIGEGVKIDNLVQIAHNVEVGRHSVIAAQTGVSGSTSIGEGVTMGGACATSHHVRIAAGSVLGGRTGVTSNIDEPGEYWGTPARPIREAIKASLLVYRLPEIMSRLRALERALDAKDERPERS